LSVSVGSGHVNFSGLLTKKFAIEAYAIDSYRQYR